MICKIKAYISHLRKRKVLKGKKEYFIRRGKRRKKERECDSLILIFQLFWILMGEIFFVLLFSCFVNATEGEKHLFVGRSGRGISFHDGHTF